MWAEAALRISAAAEYSDLSYADFQRLNIDSVQKPGGIHSRGTASSVVPCFPLSSSPSPPVTNPSSSFPCEHLLSRGGKGRSRARAFAQENSPTPAPFQSPDTAERRPNFRKASAASTEAASHGTSSAASVLEFFDGDAKPEDRDSKKLLIHKSNSALECSEQQPLLLGTQALSLSQAAEPGSDGGFTIYPTPRCVLKCRTESKEKIFINLCAHKLIERWHYKDILLDGEDNETSNEGIRIPLSVGERTECDDKAGALALAVDVVFNAGTLDDCLKQSQLKQLLAQFAMAAVSHKYKLKLQGRGSYPPPQRIKAAKTPEISQFTSTPSAPAAAKSSSSSSSLAMQPSREVGTPVDSVLLPTFECWFLRPAKMRAFISFIREKLSEATAPSPLHSRPESHPEAAIVLEPVASFLESRLANRSDEKDKPDGWSRQDGANATSSVLFISEWLATACAGEADAFDDAAELEQRGAINAFDFDRVACNASQPPAAGAPTLLTETPLAEEKSDVPLRRTETQQPRLPMKRAFLLSAEEKRQHTEEVVVWQSLLQGTIFVLQLVFENVTEEPGDDGLTTVAAPDDSVCRGPYIELTQSNASGGSSPAAMSKGSVAAGASPKSSDNCLEALKARTAPKNLETVPSPCPASAAKKNGLASAASRSLMSVKKPSSTQYTSIRRARTNTAVDVCASTLPLVEISDTQLLISGPKVKPVFAARQLPRSQCNSINTSSSCLVDHSSSSLDTTLPPCCKAAVALSSSVVTTPQKFLYVFPFAFRSDFAYAWLCPGDLLTVLVPTDLAAAAVLEEEVMLSSSFPACQEIPPLNWKSAAYMHQSTDLHPLVARSCEGSSVFAKDSLFDPKLQQSKRGETSLTKGPMPTQSFRKAAAKADIRDVAKGFANEFFDVIF